MIDSYVVAHGIKWKLEGWLESKGKTRYELARAMGGNEKANQTTLYRLGTAERIDHKTLSRVILAAEKLTGQRPNISDLLEYEGEKNFTPSSSKVLKNKQDSQHPSGE